MNRYFVSSKKFSYCGINADRFEVCKEYNTVSFFVGDVEAVFFDLSVISRIEIRTDDRRLVTVFEEESNG